VRSADPDADKPQNCRTQDYCKFTFTLCATGKQREREYHKTKDLLPTMAFLGPNKSDYLLLYVQLYQKLFKDMDDSPLFAQLTTKKKLSSS
jgi:hypothetical protein